MSLKAIPKTIMFSALTLSLITATAKADELVPIWSARSVEEIKADVENSDKQSYIIKYGDTLSTIAQALDIDMGILAKVNQISDINLIFPNTILTTRTNSQEEVTSIEVQAPHNQETAEEGEATVVLDEQQAVVDHQAIASEEDREPTGTSSVDVAPSDSVEVAGNAQQVPAEEQVAEVPPVAETPVAMDEQQAVVGHQATASEEYREPTADVASSDSVEVGSNAQQAPVEEQVAEAPPVAETSVTAAPQASHSNSVALVSNSVDFASIAAANPLNVGLQPQTAAFKEEVAAIYGITSFSLHRPGDNGDHGKGLAVDFIVGNNTELGDQIANYAIQQIGAKNISYIIWKQRFYSPSPNIYGAANTWNLMPDRGSITENHYDHVHVSMNP
ncbi:MULTISPECIES: LysM domain-containing protein [unclassified Streptococcus]|uniref:LysM peptidoglycan-binding domain-containing protein n=1 Tax=unclassified Streptococcus TaxID=2608887 RepID=UPI001071B6BE|nr:MULTISPECIES: LysM domain-containing protein [unclassified Streptococcus]MBF0787179.1 LysM peptidoglycan-binding domain-containing protein [Streptococcus sp. 19428wC2_LYSM12]MCQ9212105.1 LysM peptidoglycan-binding domain-containing protein [Streptococcus sp. B01]MCQ9213434.1 LysM peptidoglycan-binding domain-containing protein [Streptococcus sp. O1]TFV05929.1 LysM peptidoglycan-binding domain-containing protein [Streptococcus sp. LYSM12]